MQVKWFLWWFYIYDLDIICFMAFLVTWNILCVDMFIFFLYFAYEGDPRTEKSENNQYFITELGFTEKKSNLKQCFLNKPNLLRLFSEFWPLFGFFFVVIKRKSLFVFCNHWLQNQFLSFIGKHKKSKQASFIDAPQRHWLFAHFSISGGERRSK